MATDHDEAVLQVIEQLSKYVEQLMACTEDPQVDVGALNRACANRFSALQQLMPVQASSGNKAVVEGEGREKSRLLEAFQALDAKTRVCIEVLKDALEHTEEELQQYRDRKKAILAYAGKR